MPRKEIDYSKIVIYKIACNDLNVKDIYVGSTTDFIKRKSSHKKDSNKHKNLKVYNMINSYGGWDNWCMIKIEDYPCKSSIDARARERYQYELLNATLNMVRPIMTKEERRSDKRSEYKRNKETYQSYYEINKKELNKTKLEYYYKNKDEINAKKREQHEQNNAYQVNYRKENNEKVCERERKWYHENKEHIRARVRISKKAWYEANKDAINEKRREKNKLKKDLEKTQQ